jgi:vacuolar-type H+-ATPase catalytic subunit A/Vma1
MPRPPCKRYLAIFTLVVIHGRTYAEVARQLGIKPKSVADICSRVRTWLRRNRARLERMAEIQERIEMVHEAYAAVLAAPWPPQINWN